MKLNIYTVLERRPPIDEPVILWDIDKEEIFGMHFEMAIPSIPDNEEEKALIPVEEVPDMSWEKREMRWKDRWSYSFTLGGE